MTFLSATTGTIHSCLFFLGVRYPVNDLFLLSKKEDGQHIHSINESQRCTCTETAWCTTLNVTSAQRKASHERHDLSPMTNRDGGFRGFFNFEAWWQSRKKWEGIPWETSVQWWKGICTPKRRYPKGTRVLWAQSEESDERLDYITSRKTLYIPLYHEYIVNTLSVGKWKDLAATHDVVIYDFDGPRKPCGAVDIQRVTLDLLRQKVHDTTFPFGHGYVVASILAGIPLRDYL